MEEMKTIFFSHSIAKLVTKEEQTYGMARIIVSVCFLNCKSESRSWWNALESASMHLICFLFVSFSIDNFVREC